MPGCIQLFFQGAKVDESAIVEPRDRNDASTAKRSSRGDAASSTSFLDAMQFVSEAGFIGTKKTCTETASLLHAAGVDELACLIDFGVPLEETLQSLRRVAEISALLRGARI